MTIQKLWKALQKAYKKGATNRQDPFLSGFSLPHRYSAPY